MRMTLLAAATLIGFAAATSAGSAAPVYGTVIGATGTHVDLAGWSDSGYVHAGRGYCFYHPHRGRCR